MVSCIGNLGKTGIAARSLAINQQINGVIFPPDINPVFALYYFQTAYVQQWLSSNCSSTTIQIVNKSRFEVIPFPLPPLAEQCRIVAKIDGIFSERERTFLSLVKIPELVQTYSASLLHEAMVGRLTAGWRAEHPIDTSEALSKEIIQSHQTGTFSSRDNAALPTEGVHNLSKDDIPSSWSILELRHLCRPGKPITYGILKPGPDVEGGIPYVRVVDYPENKIVVDTVRRTSKKIADQYRRSQLAAADLLLSIRGTVGRVCEVPMVLDGANITQDTARVSVHPLVSRDYVRYYLQSPLVQNKLRKATRGVAIRVNLGEVRSSKSPYLPWPSNS